MRKRERWYAALEQEHVLARNGYHEREEKKPEKWRIRVFRGRIVLMPEKQSANRNA